MLGRQRAISKAPVLSLKELQATGYRNLGRTPQPRKHPPNFWSHRQNRSTLHNPVAALKSGATKSRALLLPEPEGKACTSDPQSQHLAWLLCVLSGLWVTAQWPGTTVSQFLPHPTAAMVTTLCGPPDPSVAKTYLPTGSPGSPSPCSSLPAGACRHTPAHS